MINYFENIRSAFAGEADARNQDRGDLVQTVLLVAGFAVAALVTVNWLSTSILNKAADVSQCIEGANTYNTAESAQNCESANHSDINSFSNDEAYTGRYGG